MKFIILAVIVVVAYILFFKVAPMTPYEWQWLPQAIAVFLAVIAIVILLGS